MQATHQGEAWVQNSDSQQQLRRAVREDIAEIVEIHQLAFADHFLTQLGPGFLRVYYDVVHTFRDGILLVSVGPRGADGFVAGFMRPGEFYERMMWNWWRFGVPVMSALVRRPSLAGRVLYHLWKLHKPVPKTPSCACELSSIAVHPANFGKGVGTRLINAFLERAWTMGADHVYLTTDADDNDGTNLFYSRSGFHLRRTFRQLGGRFMNEYIIRPWPSEDEPAVAVERLGGRG
jgi:ribosomal protein S18 acetylase RimI-like enzyme